MVSLVIRPISVDKLSGASQGIQEIASEEEEDAAHEQEQVEEEEKEEEE